MSTPPRHYLHELPPHHVTPVGTRLPFAGVMTAGRHRHRHRHDLTLATSLPDITTPCKVVHQRVRVLFAPSDLELSFSFPHDHDLVVSTNGPEPLPSRSQARVPRTYFLPSV